MNRNGHDCVEVVGAPGWPAFVECACGEVFPSRDDVVEAVNKFADHRAFHAAQWLMECEAAVLTMRSQMEGGAADGG